MATDFENPPFDITVYVLDGDSIKPLKVRESVPASEFRYEKMTRDAAGRRQLRGVRKSHSFATLDAAIEAWKTLARRHLQDAEALLRYWRERVESEAFPRLPVVE